MSETSPPEPVDVEKLLKEHDLLSLFEHLSFREKVRKVLRGLRAPKDSGEYKYARLQVARLSAPLAAVVVPIGVLALMVATSGLLQPEARPITVRIIDPEPAEKIDEVEKLDDEPLPPPEPIDVDFAVPSENLDLNLPPTPATDFSPQPAMIDSVAIVKSPVIMKGIIGSRSPGMRGQALQEYGGSGVTEGAVLRALRWLKKYQEPEGYWTETSGREGGGKGGGAPAAMTAMALLAYLGHGETPSSEEFGPTVEKAIRWLVERQGRDGSWRRHYEHQIAVYALAEAYALTKVPMIKEAAEKGLDIIIRGQNPGGLWNYPLTPCDRNDTTVAAWCAQALKAAKMAGFSNPGLDECMKKAIDGFRANAAPDGGFGYTGPGKGGLTGAGCLSLQFLGAAKAKETVLGLQYLVNARNTFVWKGATWKDIYYWYYDTQARFHAGVKIWEDWNKAFALELVRAQTVLRGAGVDGKDIGYWSCGGEDGDRHGWVMNTALCTLMLEVYYRYLPTYKTARIMEDQLTFPETGPSDIRVDIDLGGV